MDTQQPQELATKNAHTKSNKKSSLKLRKVIIATLVLVLASAAAFAVVLKRDSLASVFSFIDNKGAHDGTVKNKEKIPTPKTKMIATTMGNYNGNLWLVNTDTSKYKAIEADTLACCTSGQNVGESYMTMPNKLQTLVALKDKGLYILSHEDFKTYQINTLPNIASIIDISPDSTQAIVYYSYGKPVGIDMSGTSSSSKHTGYDRVGYQLLDIASGKLTSLSQLEGPTQFAGNSTILSINAFLYDQKQVDTYDVTNNTLTQSAVANEWGFGFSEKQLDFNSSGSKWAYMNSKGSESSSMYIRDFPAGDELSIATGTWDQYQLPRFSEDDSKVYYVVKGTQNAEGIDQYEVWQYDVSAKTSTKVTDGMYVGQNGNKILVMKRSTSIFTVQLSIFDTETNTSTDVSSL